MAKKDILIASISLITVIVDQLAKYWATDNLKDIVPVIGSIFRLQLTTNTGAGFGVIKGYNALLIWVIIIIIGFLLYHYDKIPQKPYLWISYALILGGAVGNLIDRILLGHVIDFLDFIYWPAFNVADSAITVGAIIVGIYLIFEKE